MTARKKGTASGSDIVIFIAALVAIAAVGIFLWMGVARVRQGKKKPSQIFSRDLPPGARVLSGAKRDVAATRPAVKMDFSRPAPPLPEPARTAAPPPAVEIPLVLETGALVMAVSAPPASALPPVKPGELQTVRLAALADTCIQVNPGTAPERNAGRLGELPVKGNESFVLARYDTAPIRGWTIHRAAWHARIRSGQPHTLGFSTLGAPWEEGAHTPAESPSGGATFRWARFNRVPWRADKAPFTHLLRGQPGYLFAVSGPRAPSTEENPWIEVPLHPILVQALVCGAADSLVISDEKGQLDSSFTISSREMPDEAHFIEIQGVPRDFVPPAAPADLKVRAHGALRRPQTAGVVLEWTAPGDDGSAGRAFRYDVRFAPAPAAFEKATSAPPHQVPWPAEAGAAERMILQGLKPDTAYTFFVRALDEAGTPGPVAETTAKTPGRLGFPAVEKAALLDARPIEVAGGALAFRVLAETDGLDPGSGEILDCPSDLAARRTDQSLLWDRSSRTIHLQAAAGETVGFQMMFSRLWTAVPPLHVRASAFETSAGPLSSLALRFYETGCAHFPTRRSPLAWHIDQLLPLATDRFDPGKSVFSGRMPDQAHHVLYAELSVPPDAPAGLYRGGLVLADGKTPEVNVLVLLNILPVRLPDRPRFAVELQAPPVLARQHNRKELASRGQGVQIENQYHRLAREHRGVLAVRPYLSQGAAAPWLCPPLAGSGTGLTVKTWAPWDAQFDRLLSGRLFALSNLHTFALSHLWLPVFESWPTPLANGLTCDDALTARPDGLRLFTGDAAQLAECLSPDYRAAWTAMLDRYQAHFKERGWDQTDLHVWLVNGPTNTYRGQSPPWSLGQPLFRDDFLALEMYAKMVPPGSALVFRVTIPDAAALAGYGRGLFKLLCVSDRSSVAWDLLRSRAAASGETLWIQNEFMPLNETPLSTLAGVLRAFLKGADGWTLRETTAPTDDPAAGQPQALMHNGRLCGGDGPLPSLRLKAVRRLQQDIEYLLLLQDKMGWTREQLADFVQAVQPNVGDPYKMTGEDLARLRLAVQERLVNGE